MNEILTVLGTIADLASLQQWLASFLKRNKGLKRAFLAELKHNAKVIEELFLKKNIDPLHVIPMLKTKEFGKFESSDVSFNVLKRAKVRMPKLQQIPSLAHFDGKSTEEIIETLYARIRILQEYTKAASSNASLREKIRFDVRLQNIAKLLVVLLIHLRS